MPDAVSKGISVEQCKAVVLGENNNARPALHFCHVVDISQSTFGF